MSELDVAKRIYDRYINDPAGFAVRFTNIFEEKDGTPQTLYPLQIRFLNEERKPAEIIVVVKCRQCLTGDSMVYTLDGPKSIKSLLDSDYRGKVYTIDKDGNNVIDDVVDVWGAGKKVVYEVKLASGERIKASKDHKIKTVNGWKKVSELSVGDLVVNFEGNFGNETLSDEELIVMGYYITDGTYSNSTPKFTNINQNYLKEFSANVTKFDSSVTAVWKPKGNGYDINVVGGPWGTNKTSSFGKYLTDLGLRGVDSNRRVLPKKFLNLNKECTSLLLNRIFAGDGWYSSCGKNRTNEVGIGSPSLEFLYQIAYLLSKYGIHASIYPVNSGTKQKSVFYKLKFSSNEYVEKFINEIGIYDKEPRSEINYSYKIHKIKNRVVSIKEIGEQETYDLMTSKHNSFIANGILVHNSGFSTSIKALALHRAYFGLVPNILIASASERQATKILYEMREHIESMPEWMRPELSKDNASEIHFKSGSKIISLPANPQTVRGFSGMVFWDEAALFNRKDSEKFFSAIFPSISKGYQLILVSTPESRDNIFFDLCNPKPLQDGEVAKGIRASKIIKVMWNKVPHIKKFIEDGGFADYSNKTFLQEYCCEFLEDDENSLFTSDLIDNKFIDKELSVINVSHLDHISGPTIEESDKINLKERYEKIYIGFDPAISDSKDADGSGICAIGIKGDEWEVLLAKNLTKGMSQTKQCEYVSRLCLCLNADKVGFDSTGGMGLTFKERLEEMPIQSKLVPVNFSGITFKPQECIEIKHKIEANKFKSPLIVELRKQMLNLGYNPQTQKIAAMGNWRKNKDDIFFSLLCAHACRQKTNGSMFHII